MNRYLLMAALPAAFVLGCLVGQEASDSGDNKVQELQAKLKAEQSRNMAWQCVLLEQEQEP